MPYSKTSIYKPKEGHAENMNTPLNEQWAPDRIPSLIVPRYGLTKITFPLIPFILSVYTTYEVNQQ